MSGVVIVDAACLKHFADRTERELISRSLRAAGLMIYPSIVNLVEISKSQNPRVSSRAYEIVAALATRVGLLPLPQEILADTGRALRDGKRRYFPAAYSPEVALDEHGAIAAAFRTAARQYIDPFEKSRAAHMSKWRPIIQRQLKERGLSFVDAVDFLTRQWDGTEAQDTYARLLWEELDLPDYPGLERVLEVPTWRVFLAAEGHMLYERLVLRSQLPGTAGFVDLSQLVYASAGSRALLVTDDQGLRRAGQAVVSKYLANARVEDWRTFRAHHPDRIK